MNEWQKKMIDVISTHFDCADCPLDDKECKDEDWANCEELLSHLLFQESYPNISEEKCKCKEKEEEKPVDEEKKNFMDFIGDLVMHDIMYGTPSKPPFESITVKIGDMTVFGKPREIAEFLRQAGEMLAP